MEGDVVTGLGMQLGDATRRDDRRATKVLLPVDEVELSALTTTPCCGTVF